MNSTSSHGTFGQVLADLLIKAGYVRKIKSPDWAGFADALPDVSYETLRKAVADERPASPALMCRAATALDAEPTVFIEYRLQQARRELDPAQVGLRRASDALIAWETFRQIAPSTEPAK